MFTIFIKTVTITNTGHSVHFTCDQNVVFLRLFIFLIVLINILNIAKLLNYQSFNHFVEQVDFYKCESKC